MNVYAIVLAQNEFTYSVVKTFNMFKRLVATYFFALCSTSNRRRLNVHTLRRRR